MVKVISRQDKKATLTDCFIICRWSGAFMNCHIDKKSPNHYLLRHPSYVNYFTLLFPHHLSVLVVWFSVSILHVGTSKCILQQTLEHVHRSLTSVLTFKFVQIPLSLRYDRKSMTVWMTSPSAILRAPVEANGTVAAC